MKRRDSIKTMFLGSIGASLTLNSCITTEDKVMLDQVWKYNYGRTYEELKWDYKVLTSKFFSDSELKTIEKIANIILPPNEKGNIKDAGVVELFEIIAKDFSTPAHDEYGEKVLRRGLNVFDKICNERFGVNLIDCSDDQIKSVFDSIAFNDNKDEGLQEAIRLFAVYRGMVLTGYFTSEVGINDLGYKGNTPNVWDGVPDDVLKDYSVSYDDEWISRCVDQSKRNDLAEWDDDGNLLT
ncbi:MAG: gluconate 2-dehydrogenase subunit 3 family protein [Candidatus Marisimplicoccus sp.]|tara:strand:+ start:3584 stop:4300 length:717 start_codon:yes stop_codon:yes gene_type:complete